MRGVLFVCGLAAWSVACTPSNASEAERKHDVSWLGAHPSSEAISALGRIADDDKTAQDALETLATTMLGGKAVNGASALDVYLAAWGAVERHAAWGTTMMKRALADAGRMNDAASALKRASPELEAFVPDLDAALRAGCDVHCGSALASGSSSAVTGFVTSRLADDRTRDPMCAGLGSQESSKEARAVFTHVPDSSRDALSCPGAAARMAARDDDVLAWLGKSAEPGLLRATGTSDALPCDRVAKLWSMAFAARDHNVYGALAIPLGASVKRCAKALDGTLSGALVSDVDSQTLAVSAIDPFDASVADLVASCTALPNVARSATSPPTKARAQDILTRCKR